MLFFMIYQPTDYMHGSLNPIFRRCHARTMLAQAAATMGGGIGGALAATKIETLNPEKMECVGNILQRDQSAVIAVLEKVVVPIDKLDAEDQVMCDEVLLKVGRDNTLQEGNDVAIRIAVTDDEGIVVTRE
jgi:hypothetical protein